MILPSLTAGTRRIYLVRLLLIGVAEAGVVIAMTLLLRAAFDQLIIGDVAAEPGTLLKFLAGFSLIIMLGAWLRWRARIDAEQLGQDYVFELRQQLFSHMSRLSPRALQRRSRGGTMLRFVGDLTALRQWVSLGIARLMVAAVASAGTLLVLAYIDAMLSMLIAALLTSASIAMFFLGRVLESTARTARRQRSRLAANTSEKIAAMAVVQAFGQQQRERRFFKKQSKALREAMVQRANCIGQSRALIDAVVGFASSGAILLGAWEVSHTQTTPGTIVAAMMVVRILAPSLRDLGRVHEYWRGAKVSREKILQFLGTRGRIEQKRNAPDLEVTQGEIEFRNITLQGVLTGFTAHASAGERIAVIGPNGAGKSTLLYLVARLLDPDSGQILIDGQDISQYSLRSVRACVGIVAPDLPLLRGSVERNLKYRFPAANLQQIQEVNTFCDIDEMVKALPQGLRTRITDAGTNLSVGQRARLALARALLGSPPILLLDEADANLDSEAAGLIDRIVATYPGTILMATHLQSRLTRVDQVWRLDGGMRIPDSSATDADQTHASEQNELTLVS